MRKGWTVETGTPEELELNRLEKWRKMTPQLRLDAMFELQVIWKGPAAYKVDRVYRSVTVPLIDK